MFPISPADQSILLSIAFKMSPSLSALTATILLFTLGLPTTNAQNFSSTTVTASGSGIVLGFPANATSACCVTTITNMETIRLTTTVPFFAPNSTLPADASATNTTSAPATSSTSLTFQSCSTMGEVQCSDGSYSVCENIAGSLVYIPEGTVTDPSICGMNMMEVVEMMMMAGSS